jgi:hypothetical protein
VRDVQPPDHAPHNPLARLISENYQLAEAPTRTLQNAERFAMNPGTFTIPSIAITNHCEVAA